jgi:AraC-like DNA-binding protein
VPAAKLTPILGTRQTGRDPVVSLVSRYLISLTTRADQLSEADGIRLAGVTVDLISLMLSRRLDLDRGLPPDTRTRAMLARVQAFALARLGDPALSPEMIAAAHHLSLRTLQRLFRENDLTVAEWIRQARLERCRRDLSDPAHADRTVTDIARRWGFVDPAHFSRTFKNRFGHSPQAYRERRLG